MNFSGYELQIFVSVLIVLGCAFVALLVDYLKGNNEKLRESHVDLLARQDSVVNRASADTSLLLKALGEQTSALRLMINRPIHVTSVMAPAVSAPVSLANFPVTSIPMPRREPVEEPAPELEKVKVALIPETRVVNPEPAPLPVVKPVVAEPDIEPVIAETIAVPVARVESPTEVKSPAEEVLQPNVIRIRLMPEVVRPETKVEEPNAVEEAIVREDPAVELEEISAIQWEGSIDPELVPELVEELVEELIEAEASLIEAVVAEPEAEPARAEPVKVEPVKVDPVGPDFERFLDDLVTEFEGQPDIFRDIPAPEAPTSVPLPEPEPVHSHFATPMIPSSGGQPDAELYMDEGVSSNVEELTPNLDVPLGTHAPEVLLALLERKELLTGLVVSVGINEYGQIHENLGRAAAEELLGSVDSLMGSLAGADGFCTRKKVDEFILIFPKTTGSGAQRRLSELSERLWDFQLRNLGSFSVVFSWGASEAQRELLSETMGSANERMMETQSSRKSVSMDRSRRRRATA